MPSSLSPFISRDDLGDVLGRTVTSDDGALIAVDAACDICRDIAEQSFNRVNGDTIYLDGTDTDALRLPELPVVAAGTVSLRDSEGSWTTAGTADYTVSRDGVLLATNTLGTASFGTTWPRGRQNVRVTYDHGFADADLPRSVRAVAIAIASRLVVQGVAQFESAGDSSIRYGTEQTDLTNGEKAILTKYRRR